MPKLSDFFPANRIKNLKNDPVSPLRCTMCLCPLMLAPRTSEIISVVNTELELPKTLSEAKAENGAIAVFVCNDCFDDLYEKSEEHDFLILSPHD